MFYPDLEENSSRGIKSGAISKYQCNVGLCPAAFTLWLILLTKLLNNFTSANLPLQWHPFSLKGHLAWQEKDITESGTECKRIPTFVAPKN